MLLPTCVTNVVHLAALHKYVHAIALAGLQGTTPAARTRIGYFL